jgi:DNA-binding CsgD family transcriptional regulator
MLMDGDTTQPTTWRWIRRDGTILWTEGRRTFLYDDQGAVAAIETVARDISLEREAEARAEQAQRRQRLLLEAVTDAMVQVNRAGEVLEFVPASHGGSAFISDVMAGRPLWACLPADASQSLASALNAALDTSLVQVSRFDVQHEAHDLTFEARIAPLDQNEGVVFIRDVTGDVLMAAARERTEATEEIEQKAERRILRENPYGLTFREFTVLELVAAGMTDKRIAMQLGISLNTVGKHVSNILGKMGVSSRTEASVRAVHERLLD